MPTMTDLFCGGGGSATGATAVPGNAVTPCTARDLLAAVTEAITGEEIDPAAANAAAA
ncbi:hypothetical protein [Nocardiopsis suaedae]|uniref:Uncharacterized protein n=1 Tax=Nocardiopsis suaedae TaxID=3018444 RepID=A0ABT4TIT0_9ACTN|nr:hypothetical protein [Nocardiopsis suaedae]MDA2804570.1 hypothetical protein [Nocardiopsis suaedae]